MNNRYQVYISSTYDDLEKERSELAMGLYEINCIPTGVNGLRDQDDTTWPVIKQLINDCDVFIVVVAGKYGETSPTGVSYPHREYVHALAQRKPILAFIHEYPGALPHDKKEIDKVANLRLYEFKALLQKQDTVLWNASQSLVAMAKVKLQQLILNGGAGIGWSKQPQPFKLSEYEQRSTSPVVSRFTTDMMPGTLEEESLEVNFTYRLYQRGYSNQLSGQSKVSLAHCFNLLSADLVAGGSDDRLLALMNRMLEKMDLFRSEGLTSDCRVTNFELEKDSFNLLKSKLLEYQLIGLDGEQRSQWYLTSLGSQKRLQNQRTSLPD